MHVTSTARFLREGIFSSLLITEDVTPRCVGIFMSLIQMASLSFLAVFTYG
jgi:hypothetical protein